MTKFNLKLKLISIIIFILTLILLYFIYKCMNSYVIVNENFDIETTTTKETYDSLQRQFTKSDFVNKNDTYIAEYDSLKIDYSEYANEDESVKNSPCKQKMQNN